MEEEILKKYFQDKMKQIDIARELNISKYKVSRIVNRDFRYKKEKERRREANQIKNREVTKNYINQQRKKKKDNLEYERLKQDHIQASIELSDGRKGIDNRNFKRWNSSIYKYNTKKRSYQLIRGINVGVDVPKNIVWK